MKYLVKRGNNVFYFRRNVPTHLQDKIGKREVWISLKTKDRSVAADRYAIHDNKYEVLFNTTYNDNPENQLEKLIDLAETLGMRYSSAAATNELPAAQKISTFIKKVETWKNEDKANDTRFDAIFGAEADEQSTIEDFYNFLIAHNSKEKLRKTSDEYRKWVNPRKRWLRDFVQSQGNMKVSDITPSIVYDYKKELQCKIEKKQFSGRTASKGGSYLRGIIECRNEELQLGIKNPFLTLRFEGKDGKRDSIPTDQITEVLLKDGFLDGLNEEAKAVLLLMINTGGGAKELLGIKEVHIKLTDNTPHIIIESTDERNLKNEHRPRKIPLVGVSLEALRAFPKGFPKYGVDGGADQLSACLNKFLREHNYLKDGQSAYSHRHSLKDRMRNAGFEDSLMDEIMGHAEKGPSYGEGYSLEYKQKQLAKISL